MDFRCQGVETTRFWIFWYPHVYMACLFHIIIMYTDKARKVKDMSACHGTINRPFLLDYVASACFLRRFGNDKARNAEQRPFIQRSSLTTSHFRYPSLVESLGIQSAWCLPGKACYEVDRIGKFDWNAGQRHAKMKRKRKESKREMDQKVLTGSYWQWYKQSKKAG